MTVLAAKLSRLWPLLVLGAIALMARILPGPIGQIALYPALGVFPGCALAWLLFPDASSATRAVVGVALAPLVASIAGWALAAAGLPFAVATGAIAATTWLLWASLSLRDRRGRAMPEGEDAPAPRALWLLALGLAVAVAIPHLINPWMLVKSDAWNHAAIVHQILERGMPPEDPRFAALRLNYVWFFNLFVGMLSSVNDGSPFVFMTLLNVMDVALIGWLVWITAWMLWRERDAALGSALLACFGFNAFSWVLWPLRGLTGALGHNRSWELLKAACTVPRFASWRIMQDLGAPNTYIENFVDKFVTGTSINYSWILMLLFLWSLIRLMRGASVGAWVVIALAAAGMQLWHGVVGLSVVPVALSAGIVALLARRFWPWLPTTRTIAGGAAATVAGFAAAAPYIWSISRGWDSHQSGLHVSPIHLERVIGFTTATSCAFALALAARPVIRAWRERRGAVAWLAIYAFGMLCFSILIALPNANEVKFPIQAFFALALLGGGSFLALARRVRARWGTRGALLFAALLVLPHVLTLVGFTLDPERNTYAALHPAPGEDDLYAWIRTNTPREMVFVDEGYRDLVMVRARRQLYLGSSSGPERAAFPLAQVIERRAVMADLFGASAALDSDAGALRRLGRPACVICRVTAAPGGAAARASLARRPDLFRAIYDREGFVLYAVVMDSTDSAGRP